MNKETLQNYNNRLNENNNTINNINSLLKRLPTGSEDLTEELTTYDTELTEQEDLVDVITKALEGKASGGDSGGGSGGGSSLNLFIQPDEPATKEGIWLQTDEELSDKITVTNQSYVAETTLGTWVKHTASIALFSVCTAKCGDWIYGFGAGGVTNNAKYNINTKETVTLAAWTEQRASTSAAVTIGTDIYVFGGYGWSTSKYAYKYDTLTDTYVRLEDTPYPVYGGVAIAIGDYIYIICGQSYNTSTSRWSNGRSMLKYDTVNNTYTTIANAPMYMYHNAVVAVGSDLYFIMGWTTTSINPNEINKSIYKYDTTTYTITKVGELPVSWNYPYARATVVGDEIYVLPFGAQSTVGWIYNINTGESRTDSNFNTNSINQNCYGLYTHTDNKQIIDCATSTAAYTINYSQRFDYTGDEDTILMRQRNGSNPYQTVLTPATNVENRLLTSFEDVGYYSTETGINNDIPTYYGTGTEWVKFKG